MISEWQTSSIRADMADWLTVLAYLFAAFLSARAARHAMLNPQARESTFWRATAVIQVLLGINELLDLQTLLTSLGRAHAKANGWYGEHRRVQYLFVVGLAVAAMAAGTFMLWLTRRTHAAVRLALAGLVLIGLFVLLRAASFHHLNEVLGGGAPAFTWGSLQEMAGILTVAAAAALYTCKRQNEG